VNICGCGEWGVMLSDRAADLLVDVRVTAAVNDKMMHKLPDWDHPHPWPRQQPIGDCDMSSLYVGATCRQGRTHSGLPGGEEWLTQDMLFTTKRLASITESSLTGRHEYCCSSHAGVGETRLLVAISMRQLLGMSLSRFVPMRTNGCVTGYLRGCVAGESGDSGDRRDASN